MTIDAINRSLRERFERELPDCYERRIIFWYDSEREFEHMLDELELPNVKILQLTGTNTFYAKMLLSETDQTSNYLVYNPLSYKQVQDNWLRDIEHYSEEFRADLVSMQMEELHIPQTTQLRRAMKHYAKFFESKERVAKLAALHTKYENPGQLHVDIMAVLSGTKQNTVQGVIRAILCDSLYEDENCALENILKFGNEEALREMIGKFTGYAEEKFSLHHLMAHICINALSAFVDGAVLSGLEQFVSEECQPFCYLILDEWAESSDAEKLYDLVQEIQMKYDLSGKMNQVETAALVGVDCLPCVDESLIGRFMLEIGEGVIKHSEILDMAEKRRAMKWYNRYPYFYDGLYYMAKMQEFYLDHITGFHYGEYKQLWEAYCSELYLMDMYYRKFCVAFGLSLKSAVTDLDDAFKNAADTMERLYKNWYLSELNQQWNILTAMDFEVYGCLNRIPQQRHFYQKNVNPVVRNSGRVFVIISDALRYEVASELTERLLRETNGTADLSAMQSVFPSATKYGMAALLPHETLALTDTMEVYCDGLSSAGTQNRDDILKRHCPQNAAVTYQTFLSMKQSQRRELCSGAETVYIYHNTIDAVGDKTITENQVCDACENAIEELKNLVKLLVNSVSASNILITADHGFIYTHQPLEEYDKADKALIEGKILEFDRRSTIAETDSTSDIMLKIPLVFDSQSVGFAPKEMIRIKKQGGGMNYVHGGVSLQEYTVPVITFKNIRAGSKKFVDIKKVSLQLLTQSRKISNNLFTLEFFQQEAVGGKIVPATYEVYLCDSMGRPASDVQTIIADKTTEDPKQRVQRIRFTLKGQNFSGDEKYYLNVVDKESTDVMEHIEFSVKIAFANDFDF